MNRKEQECADLFAQNNFQFTDKNEFTKAFRQWALINHPDKGGNPILFNQVSECKNLFDTKPDAFFNYTTSKRKASSSLPSQNKRARNPDEDSQSLSPNQFFRKLMQAITQKSDLFNIPLSQADKLISSSEYISLKDKIMNDPETKSLFLVKGHSRYNEYSIYRRLKKKYPTELENLFLKIEHILISLGGEVNPYDLYIVESFFSRYLNILLIQEGVSLSKEQFDSFIASDSYKNYITMIAQQNGIPEKLLEAEENFATTITRNILDRYWGLIEESVFKVYGDH